MPTPSQSLRRALRQKRKSISTHQRERFDFSIHQSILKTGILLRASSVASYLANDGEPAVHSLIQTCKSMKRSHYLPTLKKQQLAFSRYTWGDSLTDNAFNIPEPSHQQTLAARFLSVIFTPLVGFDLQGNRLGMGGGYYDRTLNFTRHDACKRKPLLIGIAYSAQKTDHIQHQPWDIPLDAVITEQGTLRFSTKAKQQLRKP